MKKLTTTVLASAVSLALAAPALAQQQGAQGQGQQGQQQAQGQQAQQQKGIVSVSGEVVGFTDIKTTAGDQHKVVKIRTAAGTTAVADLGSQAPLVGQGDRIFVSGRSARIAGKPVIFARYVGKIEEVARTGQQQAAAGAGTAGVGAGAVWNEPNWNTDQFGLYDEDLSWGVENGADFDTFYGDAEAGWGTAYEDEGDEGWFDI